MDEFLKSVELSLDNDLAALLRDRKVGAEQLMVLQMLRIMRGRPFKIELNVPETSTQGWTDGKVWFPNEPGTFTTGDGGIYPEGTK